MEVMRHRESDKLAGDVEMLKTIYIVTVWVVMSEDTDTVRLPKEYVLRKDGDIGRCGNSSKMWHSSGSIICSDKEVVWGVVTSVDVAMYGS